MLYVSSPSSTSSTTTTVDQRFAPRNRFSVRAIHTLACIVFHTWTNHIVRLAGVFNRSRTNIVHARTYVFNRGLLYIRAYIPYVCVLDLIYLDLVDVVLAAHSCICATIYREFLCILHSIHTTYGIIVLAAHHSLALYENSGIVYLNSSDRVVVWFLVRSDIFFFCSFH